MPSAPPDAAVPIALALAAGLAGVAALALGALSLGYRRTLVRGLRTRHAAAWQALERPGERAVPWEPGNRRLAAFVRAGGHYRLNDADLAAAGRLHLVTARSSAVLAVVLLASVGGWLLVTPPR